ncbi:sporulation protein YjcZ [Cohnella candidum]|uniref:Sporulation protein YjcZ n=1 Tax=Cohnella candidum TaxID=2674991 RepID=A0A3G3JVW5_9BACL|nr:sporulation protein YjcZ [Cohnella candidum]AYQ72393.1 sporulation protein YjcZ [Cohnella candidum]
MSVGVGGGFSCAGFGRAAAFVLVLFILLVIILSAGFFI